MTGICGFRKALEGIPGVENMLMRYENGGAVQVFFFDDIEARVGAMASEGEVRNAVEAAIRKRAVV